MVLHWNQWKPACLWQHGVFNREGSVCLPVALSSHPGGTARLWERAGPNGRRSSLCQGTTGLSLSFISPQFTWTNPQGTCEHFLSSTWFRFCTLLMAFPHEQEAVFTPCFRINIKYICYSHCFAIKMLLQSLAGFFFFAHSSEFQPSMKLMEEELKKETKYWTWHLKVQTFNALSTYSKENSHGICLSCILNSSLTLSCLTAAWCSLNVIYYCTQSR